MDTVKHEGTRYHVGCGGIVIKGICVKCGEKHKRDILKKVFGEGPLVYREKDLKDIERKEHRNRIRKGKDIFK